MIRRRGRLLLVCGLLLLGSQPGLGTHLRWEQNGHYYELTDAMSWLQAEEQAIEWGGHLVTINNRDEELWLRMEFGSNEYFWVGFNDISAEGNWEWVSGEAVTYTNWWQGEPNNEGAYGEVEDAAIMNWGGAEQIGGEWFYYYGDGWNDNAVDNEYRGIVEIPYLEPPVASFKSLNVINLGDPQNEETSEDYHMVGGVIRFDASESYDPAGGQIQDYYWDFAGGQFQRLPSPNQRPDIVFNEAKVYTITLVVVNVAGTESEPYAESLDLSLKQGDLIFVRTAWWNIPFDLVSNYYTHVGMYIGGQWMMESIGSPNPRSSGRWGVTETPLSGWSYPSETYATLVRVATADDNIRQKAVDFVRTKSGQYYDYKVWQKKVAKPDYYCSELIWAAYYEASKKERGPKGIIDLGNMGKKGSVWPDHIINDDDTELIGFHSEHFP